MVVGNIVGGNGQTFGQREQFSEAVVVDRVDGPSEPNSFLYGMRSDKRLVGYSNPASGLGFGGVAEEVEVDIVCCRLLCPCLGSRLDGETSIALT